MDCNTVPLQLQGQMGRLRFEVSLCESFGLQVHGLPSFRLVMVLLSL
jgi:hypothetical protein